MRIEFTMDNISKWLEESKNWLVDNQSGCCTLKLDDRLAICVGWSAGYGEEERDDVIQANDNPDYAINAGIKVWTSDDLRTDFEFINFPYKENGDIYDDAISLSKDEDFDWLANALITDYEALEGLEISKDGLVKEAQNA